jgi:hypothetical protein
MTPEQRQPLGAAGVTATEAQEKYAAGQEKRLQSDIRAYLRLHDIWTDCDSMAKRRSGTKGAPDFLFCYKGKACAIEAKTSVGRLSGDQVNAIEQMRRNGWLVIVAKSVADVHCLLRSIDSVKPD